MLGEHHRRAVPVLGHDGGERAKPGGGGVDNIAARDRRAQREQEPKKSTSEIDRPLGAGPGHQGVGTEVFEHHQPRRSARQSPTQVVTLRKLGNIGQGVAEGCWIGFSAMPKRL